VILASSTVTITGVTEQFGPLSQTETIFALVTSGGAAVTSGQVTFTDAGQTQTVTVGPDGKATATFTFSLFHAQPNSHTVGANFSGLQFAVAGSSTTAQTPNSTSAYLFWLLVDYEILVALSSGMV
jgi:hypothetical protein